jgi:hypothetical protein
MELADRRFQSAFDNGSPRETPSLNQADERRHGRAASPSDPAVEFDPTAGLKACTTPN